ncbi:MAG: hypothetical protein AAGA99_22940, partial [Actinomycetota bacterium]
SADSRLHVVVETDRIVIAAQVPYAELGYLDTSGDGLIDDDELRSQGAAVAGTIVSTVRERMSLLADGEVIDVSAAGVPGVGGHASDNGASAWVVLVIATTSHDGDVDRIDLTWDFFPASTAVELVDADGAIEGALADDGTVSFALDEGYGTTSPADQRLDVVPVVLVPVLAALLGAGAHRVRTGRRRRSITRAPTWALRSKSAWASWMSSSA